MTWERMARLLEASDTLTPTQQIRMIGNALENFENKGLVLSILDKDNLTANNLGLAKAKKWLAKIFDVFESEIDGLLAAHNDLGDAIYYLDVSAETENKDGMALLSAKLILEFNCGKIDSDVFTNVETALIGMSANGRRWFIRYLLRTPRNGINRGTLQEETQRSKETPKL